MRRNGHTGEIHQFIYRKVRHIRADDAADHRFFQCFGIDQSAAGIVDQNGALLHLAESSLADHAFGRIQKRQMQRDIVTGREDLIQVGGQFDDTGQMQR